MIPTVENCGPNAPWWEPPDAYIEQEEADLARLEDSESSDLICSLCNRPCGAIQIDAADYYCDGLGPSYRTVTVSTCCGSDWRRA